MYHRRRGEAVTPTEARARAEAVEYCRTEFVAAALLDAQADALEEYAAWGHSESYEALKELSHCRGNCPECDRLADVKELRAGAQRLRGVTA